MVVVFKNTLVVKVADQSTRSSGNFTSLEVYENLNCDCWRNTLARSNQKACDGLPENPRINERILQMKSRDSVRLLVKNSNESGLEMSLVQIIATTIHV